MMLVMEAFWVVLLERFIRSLDLFAFLSGLALVVTSYLQFSLVTTSRSPYIFSLSKSTSTFPAEMG